MGKHNRARPPGAPPATPIPATPGAIAVLPHDVHKPRPPRQNRNRKSFNGRFGDNFLPIEQFETLLKAQVPTGDSCTEHHTRRSAWSTSGLTPTNVGSTNQHSHNCLITNRDPATSPRQARTWTRLYPEGFCRRSVNVSAGIKNQCRFTQVTLTCSTGPSVLSRKSSPHCTAAIIEQSGKSRTQCAEWRPPQCCESPRYPAAPESA